MNILVTGSAGFIGFHLVKSLLEDGHEVLGIDSLNDYYSQDLKNKRLDLLLAYKNFFFEKLDISDRASLDRSFRSFAPNKVVNLAAQPGVRYSLIDPYSYMTANLEGFLNIIELCRHTNVDGLIYASSSSVYGGNDKFPFDVMDRADRPISLYGATKRANELIAHSYSTLYGLNTTGLRYFTVYGPWYRPDMAMFIFIKKILLEEPIQVFNDGNMQRDFTYVDDIVAGTKSAIEKNYKCELFNLGNNRSEKLMDVIELIELELKKKAKIDFQPIQLGDPVRTCANIDYSLKKLDFKPKTSLKDGVKQLVKWYKEYYNEKK